MNNLLLCLINFLIGIHRPDRRRRRTRTQRRTELRENTMFVVKAISPNLALQLFLNVKAWKTKNLDFNFLFRIKLILKEMQKKSSISNQLKN